MKNFLLFFFFITVFGAYSQNCFSTLSAIDNFESKIIQCDDGGYAVAGTHWSASPTYRGMVTKMDSMGNLQWIKDYTTVSGSQFQSICQNFSGGYIVVGADLDNLVTLSYQYFVLSLDSAGNVLWAKTFGAPGNDRAYSVIRTNDSNFLVAGQSTPVFPFNYWLLKLDTGGNILWQKTYSSPNGTGTACSVIQTKDGGYALAGSATWNGSSEIWLLKLDSSGNVQWEKALGGPGTEGAYSLIQSSNDDYLIAGYTFPSGGYKDALVVKTDSNGNIIWNKTFGGSWKDEAYSVIEVKDESYVIAGYRQTSSSNYDFYSWLAKIDTAGNVLWEKIYGNGWGSNGYSVNESKKGGYVVSNTGTWIFSVDSIGNGITCPVNSVTAADSLPFTQLSTTATITTPTITATASTPTVTALAPPTSAPPCQCISTQVNSLTQTPFALFYPNPISTQAVLQTDFPLINATLTVYNCFGQAVAQLKNLSGQTITFHRDNLPGGLYFIRLTQDGKIFATEKLVITDN